MFFTIIGHFQECNQDVIFFPLKFSEIWFLLSEMHLYIYIYRMHLRVTQKLLYFFLKLTVIPFLSFLLLIFDFSYAYKTLHMFCWLSLEYDPFMKCVSWVCSPNNSPMSKIRYKANFFKCRTAGLNSEFPWTNKAAKFSLYDYLLIAREREREKRWIYTSLKKCIVEPISYDSVICVLCVCLSLSHFV